MILSGGQPSPSPCSSPTKRKRSRSVDPTGKRKTKKNQQEFEGRIAYYPYMRMRQRAEFPWGKNGLFEPHPRVVPDGEEPEEHH